MEIRDILTLARAGYTAEQIELFAKAEQAQPQPMQMAQPQPMQYSDPVLEQLRVLTGAVQAGNINATQQPAVRGVDDIIGNIINPKE